MYIITNKRFRIALSRFRLSSDKLEIERGRYHNIDKENRICNFCNLKAIENEYHFLLVCPLYRDIRKQSLTSYYCSWPTINKFETLLSKQNKKVITNLSKHIYHAMDLRNLLDTWKLRYCYFFLKFSCLFHMYVTYFLFFVKTRSICNAYRLINVVLVVVVVYVWYHVGLE